MSSRNYTTAIEFSLKVYPIFLGPKEAKSAAFRIDIPDDGCVCPLLPQPPSGHSPKYFLEVKNTNNDIYLHWDSHAPTNWKKGTLKTLVRRAYLINSTTEYLKQELDHLSKVFKERNNYPDWIIRQVMTEIKNERNVTHTLNDTDQLQNVQNQYLLLPYAGREGEKVVRRMNKKIKSVTQTDKAPKITYTGQKLSSYFNNKDKTDNVHLHDVVYKVKCPDDNCSNVYIGETGRRICERVRDHADRDKKSNVLKHSIESGHKTVSLDNFEIIGRDYRKNQYKRKLAEAILIKEHRPTLNSHEKSIPLKLFN